jgi:NodT family efflux transporter outer membrane factor (OMF) lipoprotein
VREALVSKPRRLAAGLTALVFAGCAVTSTPPPRGIDMPAAWSEPAPADVQPLVLDWWRAFGSAELAGLVAQALAGNPDLAIASERIRQAEAALQIAGASLFPTLDLDAGTRQAGSRPRGGPTTTGKSTDLALSASYELDLWGRNASIKRSADESLQATRFDYETVRLTLVASVAATYFDILTFRARLANARETVAIAERILAVVSSRARYGVASQLDLAQQQTAVLQARATIPPLELAERQTLNALAVLVGRPPEGFDVAGRSVVELPVPGVEPALPAGVLVRRPDIAAAEAQLAGANADVAAARAALLPSIRLTGSAGLASDALLSIGSSPTLLYSIAASLLQPIFDGGRLRGQVDFAAARERELVESYRRSILAALTDVENALVAANRTAVQEQLQTQVREGAQRTLRLAEIRYREGVDDLLSVLDAQRTLFQAQDQLAQIRLARLDASVALFRALGGGWEAPERSPATASSESR